MQVQVKKWGNSAAVRLPQAILAQLHIRENDSLSMELQPDGLMLKPIRRQKYRIEDLMAEMDEELPMVDGWDTIKACGKEW